MRQIETSESCRVIAEALEGSGLRKFMVVKLGFDEGSHAEFAAGAVTLRKLSQVFAEYADHLEQWDIGGGAPK